jgi:hypothetical protein
MAGVDPAGRFNAAHVRTALSSVMALALPNTTQDRPIFRWLVDPTFAQSDVAGDPFNWTETPSSDSPAAIPDLQGVNCAIEWGGDSESATAAGEIDQVTVTLTLLDTDYHALITHGGRLPDQVLLKQIVYDITFVPPSVALFDLDVWTVHAQSTDSDGGSN